MKKKHEELYFSVVILINLQNAPNISSSFNASNAQIRDHLISYKIFLIPQNQLLKKLTITEDRSTSDLILCPEDYPDKKTLAVLLSRSWEC